MQLFIRKADEKLTFGCGDFRERAISPGDFAVWICCQIYYIYEKKDLWF